jgi:uncharacterized small protein (DUF1192 family)
MEEAAEPRSVRGHGLNEAMREDLEVYGVADLEGRIAMLEAEIVRVRAQLERKKAGRAAADSFFKS